VSSNMQAAGGESRRLTVVWAWIGKDNWTCAGRGVLY
jgi:hypothetical protein